MRDAMHRLRCQITFAIIGERNEEPGFAIDFADMGRSVLRPYIFYGGDYSRTERMKSARRP